MNTLRILLADLKTLATVTLVAALVWLWAESESLRSTQVAPRLEISSEFAAANSGPSSSVGSPGFLEAKLDGLESGQVVRISLRGSTAGIDAIQRIVPGVLKLTIGSPGVPSTPGEHLLNLREVLAEQYPFRRSGVSIESVEPPQARVRIAQLVVVKLPVMVDVTAGEFDEPPTASPREVSVLVPEGLTLRDSYAAVAKLEESTLAEAREGERFRTNLKLFLPGLDRRPEPQTVGVEFTLKRKVSRHSEPSVPILVCLPPDEADRWQVQLKETSIRDVTVTGPADAVQAVKDRKVQLQALLVLTAEDLKNKIGSKQVVYSTLPSSISIVAKDPSVQFTITPRTSAGTSDGSAAREPR